MKTSLSNIASMFGSLNNMQYGSPLHQEKLNEAINELNEYIKNDKIEIKEKAKLISEKIYDKLSDTGHYDLASSISESIKQMIIRRFF